MLTEAKKCGLRLNQDMYERLVNGKKRKDSSREYVAASHTGKIHDSMTLGLSLIHI